MTSSTVSPPTSTTTADPPESTTIPEAATQLGGRLIWRLRPDTLQRVPGTAVGPVGAWVHGVTARADEVAFVGFDQDSSRWVLWLLNLETSGLTELTHGGPRTPSPIGIVLGDDSIDWISHTDRPATDPNAPDGLRLRRYDRVSGEVTTAWTLSFSGIYWEEVVPLGEGLLGFSGRSFEEGVPRILVVEAEEGRVVTDVTLDTDPPVIDVADRAKEFGWIRPAWDPDRQRAYVPHLISDVVTTVDLRTGDTETSYVARASSFLGRVRDAWLPAARAKGPSSYVTAVMAPDGSALFLTGERLAWEGEDSYREIPMGIRAIDPENMTEMTRTDLPYDEMVISPTGEYILATGWWESHLGGSYSWGSFGLGLLDARTLQPVLAPEVIGEAPAYYLAFSPDGRYAYATERDLAPFNENPPRTLIIDTTTLEVRTIPETIFDHALVGIGLTLEP